MTLREKLKKQLQIDYIRAPKKFFNSNNLEMTWSDTEHLYIGFVKDVEWIAALQQTSVPFFAISCTNTQNKNNVESNCRAINHVPICSNDESITCRICKQSFIVQIDVTKTSVAYKIFQDLDK